MEYSADQERQVRGHERHRQHGHQRTPATEGHDGGDPASSSSATWNRISCAAAAATRKLRSLMPAACFGSSGPPAEAPAKVYQVWPGRNVFFLDGRVVCGPDPRGLILTPMAALLSQWIFLAYVVDPSSPHRVPVSACSLTLLATVAASFWFAATSDPGIIPRDPASVSPPAEEDGNRAAPRRFVVVNGVEVRLKFCRVCSIHRPPRSAHCAVCDNCVDKFDHHCPWIGQCVGLRNYRFYLMLACAALAFYAFMLAFSVGRIRAGLDTAGAGVLGLVRSMPETLTLAAFSSMAVCVLVRILLFHAFLVAKNKTSHERQKGRYSSSPNPYDRGTLENIRECLFEKLPPPRVDFRAVAGPNLSSTTARTTASSFSSPPDDDAARLSGDAGWS